MTETQPLEVDGYTYRILHQWYDMVGPRLRFDDMGDFLVTACRRYVDPFIAKKRMPIDPDVYDKLEAAAKRKGMTIHEYAQGLLEKAEYELGLI